MQNSMPVSRVGPPFRATFSYFALPRRHGLQLDWIGTAQARLRQQYNIALDILQILYTVETERHVRILIHYRKLSLVRHFGYIRKLQHTHSDAMYIYSGIMIHQSRNF